MKINFEEDLDTHDREAIGYAKALAKFGVDIEDLYRFGVDLNGVSTTSINYESTGHSGSLPDPTGNMATSSSRQQRSRHLRETRLELAQAVKHMRKALYSAARSATI
jgi:hypothetical protein